MAKTLNFREKLLVLLRFHIWQGRLISVRFWGKNRSFGTVRFSFYYAATVCGYGAGHGSDKISQMMGGGWARSVGGLSR